RRPRLGEVARGQLNEFTNSWATTQATASDPVPAGIYRCLAVDGRLFNAQSGTPGYKTVLQILEGAYANRRLWHDAWLTPDALARSKYDLEQLGITDPAQLEQPPPVGRIVEAVVTLRTDDAGVQFNKVRSIKAIPSVAPVDEVA